MGMELVLKVLEQDATPGRVSLAEGEALQGWRCEAVSLVSSLGAVTFTRLLPAPSPQGLMLPLSPIRVLRRSHYSRSQPVTSLLSTLSGLLSFSREKLPLHSPHPLPITSLASSTFLPAFGVPHLPELSTLASVCTPVLCPPAWAFLPQVP